MQCGGGTRKRVRTCISQDGWKDCQGPKEMVETCHIEECPPSGKGI